MSQLEYLIALISIIVGLGLTNLAKSLRDLVRPGRPVRWHWLPLAWTVIVFMIVVQLWWDSFGTLQRELFGDALAFLPYLLIYLVLYLACSFALPDPTWEAPASSRAVSSTTARSSSTSEPLDLEAFYFSVPHRRGFFGTLIVLLVIGQLVTLVFPLLQGRTSTAPATKPLNVGVNLALVGLLAGLIASDRWWIHAIVTVLTFAGTAATLIVGLPSIG